MELTFKKIGDWYISEFEVTSDFNLHIEKEPKGDFYLYQRTSSSGQYDIIEDFGYKKGGDNVIDLDFQALVYPKWIKIKSAVKPLIATITTDGEVNEVVYQAKEIEITSNGTTKVTADTGYTALASVNVKVNVEGGSGGGSSEGGKGIKYYARPNVAPENDIIDLNGVMSDFWFDLQTIALSIKYSPIGGGDVNIGLTGEYLLDNPIKELGVSLDLSLKYTTLGGSNKLMTLEEFFDELYSPQNFSTQVPWRSFLKEITEEEFYNLNA